MNTDNTRLSFYGPHCKNRIETSFADVQEQGSFICPTCHQEITENIQNLAEAITQNQISE